MEENYERISGSLGYSILTNFSTRAKETQILAYGSPSNLSIV